MLSSTVPSTTTISTAGANKETVTTELSSSGTVTQQISSMSIKLHNKPEGLPVSTTSKAAACATAKPTGPLSPAKYQTSL